MALIVVKKRGESLVSRENGIYTFKGENRCALEDRQRHTEDWGVRKGNPAIGRIKSRGNQQRQNASKKIRLFN